MLEHSPLPRALLLVPPLLLAACGGDGDDMSRLESGANLADFSSSGIEVSQTEFNAADGATAVVVDVTLRNSGGLSVAGRTVILEATGSGNTIVPPSLATDASGVASFRFTSTVAEDKVLTARIKLGILSLELSDTQVIQFVDAPVVRGVARYFDRNFDGVSNAGDELEVVFDQPMSIAGADASDLDLPVTGDSFGVGAGLASASGPRVRVALENEANFKARQVFDPADLANGAASGVDAAAGSDLRGSLSGLAAVPSTPVDIEPGFVARQSLSNEPAGCVVLGDLDCNGFEDVIVGGIEGAPIRVYRNDQGTLTDTGQSFGTGATAAMALGDIDRDGDLDLLAVSRTGENRLHLNAGGGGFAAGVQIGAVPTASVVIADLTGDGALDLYLGTVQAAADEVYVGDGTGNFQRILFTAPDVAALACADFDRDGTLDIASVSPAGELLVRIGRGDGTFFAPPFSLDAGFAAECLEAADFDGDGTTDLVVGGAGSRLALGAGDGTFQAFGPAFRPGLTVTGIAPGDHDGDGDVDLVLASTTGGAVLWNRGDGDFIDPDYDPGTRRSNGLATADLDGDGDLDLVDATDGGTENLVLSGSLSGAWRFIGWPIVGPIFGVGTRGVSLDFDRDGIVDLAAANGNQVNLYRGNGQGDFALAQAKNAVDAADVSAADLNRDGYPDLVVATDGNNEDEDRILINNGAGGFLDAVDLFSVGFTTIVRTADLENDGDLDAVFGDSFTGAQGRMVLNDGNASFTSEIGIGSALAFFDFADVNCDGWVDIVGTFGNGNGSSTVYLENLQETTQPRFQVNPITTDFVLVSAVVAGDFDHDGFADFATFGNNDGSTVNRLFRGNGTGFPLGDVIPLPNSTPAVLTAHAADLDSDGDLDLLLGYTNDFGGVLLNQDGSGTFFDGGAAPFISPIPVDVDGDADVDLLGVDRAYLAR